MGFLAVCTCFSRTLHVCVWERGAGLLLFLYLSLFLTKNVDVCACVCTRMPTLSLLSSVCFCLCTLLKTCTEWKHSVIGWQTWPLSLLSFISLIRSLIYSCRSAAAISQIQLLIKCLSSVPFVHGAAFPHSLICPSCHSVLLLVHLAGELKLVYSALILCSYPLFTQLC